MAETTMAQQDPAPELPALDALPDERMARVQTLAGNLEADDATDVLYFGHKVQRRLAAMSDAMLEDMHRHDTIAAAGVLGEMVAALNHFNVDRLDPNRKPGLVDRLLGRPGPIREFLNHYRQVRNAIDGISDRLERHKTRLLHNIASLERRFAKCTAHLADLDDHIHALELHLRDAVGSDAEYDLTARMQDLKLTRMIAMQSLPSIRLVQDSDRDLVAKINSTLTNTVPLWRQQLASSLMIFRTAELDATSRSSRDLTADLLTASSRTIKRISAEAQRRLKDGSFDTQSVRAANDVLLATIKESVDLAEFASRSRVDAEQRLRKADAELKQAASAAKSRAG